MTDVTVQLADLERIIFAASVIKPIENALATFKRDPFVKPHLDFGEAAKRLEEAMRHAQRSAASARSDTLVDYNAPPDETEMELLRSLFEKTDGGMLYTVIAAEERAPGPGSKEVMSTYDRLAAKGLIRMGQVVSEILWPGQERPDLRVEQKFAVAFTARGADVAQALMWRRGGLTDKTK
jgi:hypothetical protein